MNVTLTVSSFRSSSLRAISPESITPTERSTLVIWYRRSTLLPVSKASFASAIILLSITSPTMSGCPAERFLSPSCVKNRGDRSRWDAFPSAGTLSSRSARPMTSSREVKPIPASLERTSSAMSLQ